MTLNEAKYAALLTLTGESGGTLNGLEYLWLESLVTPAEPLTLNGLWCAMLEGEGHTEGNLNNRQMAWLGSLGYTGTWNERMYQFWLANGGGGSTPLVRSGRIGFLPVYGQSNAVGNTGGTALTTTAAKAGQALMLDYARAHLDQNPANSDRVIQVSAITALSDLLEATNASESAWGETACSGMAAQALMGDGSSRVVAASLGRGSQDIDHLSRNNNEADTTNTFFHFANQFYTANHIQRLDGSPVDFLGVAFIHGEQDAANQNADYDDDLRNLVEQYNRNMATITGEAASGNPTNWRPFFISQLSSDGYNSGVGFGDVQDIAQLQLDASYVDPLVVMVCPTYWGSYHDLIHYTAATQRQLGEYMGKAARRYIVDGSFTPLRPSAVSRTGAVITLTLEGAVGAVVADTSAWADVGDYGFRYTDDSSGAAVDSVSINGSVITITLDSDPASATGKELSYAMPTSVSTNADARGNIRDSDSETGELSSSALYNWLVRFRLDPDSWTKPTEDSLPTAIATSPASLNSAELEIAARPSFVSWFDGAQEDGDTHWCASGKHGVAWTQTSAGNQPTGITLGGVPALQFSTDDYLEEQGDLNPVSDWTYVFVMRQDSTSSTIRNVLGNLTAGTSNNARFQARTYQDDLRPVCASANGGDLELPGTPDDVNIAVLCWDHNAEEFGRAVNGGGATRASSQYWISAKGYSAGYQIGRYLTSGYAEATILGILCFTEDITRDSTFYASMIATLQDRYGL